MNNNKVIIALIAVGGLFAALMLGISIGEENLTTLILVVGGGVVMAMYLGLKDKFWLLIVAGLGFNGGISFLPGDPMPWQLATLLAIPLFATLFAFRSKNLFLRWTWLDFLVLLQVLAIWQAYYRNPTGLHAFGADVVGGKPYINYAAAFIAYGILSITKTNLKIFRIAILLFIAGSLCDGVIKTLSGLFPAFADIAIHFYSGVAEVLERDVTDIDVSSTRFTFFSGLGATGVLICCSFWRPITSLNPLRPLRFFTFCVSAVLLLLSGFRGLLVDATSWFVLGSWFRNKKSDILIFILLGLFTLSLIILFNQTTRLPMAIQRTLSFLPIEVAQEARESAEKSSEWRFQMWQLALTSNRYIKNKLLGDGFGFSEAELQMRQNVILGYQNNIDPLDFYLAMGAFHGFHVETIRYTGILGLVFATAALIGFAIKAYQLAYYFKNRNEWGCILYLCIPIIIAPFMYWIIFGSYKSSFLMLIITAGLLKMLDNIRFEESRENKNPNRNSDTPILLDQPKHAV